MRIQSTWLNEDGLLGTRMTNVVILKQFPRTLVKYMPWHHSFIMTSGEVYIRNIF